MKEMANSPTYSWGKEVPYPVCALSGKKKASTNVLPVGIGELNLNLEKVTGLFILSELHVRPFYNHRLLTTGDNSDSVSFH